MCTILARALAGLAIAAPAAAQRTWLVDDNDPLADFNDLPPALSAAAAGDTVLVRAGSYANAWITKPLTVLGEPGAVVNGAFLPTIEVTGIPLGKTALVRGLSVGPTSFGTRPIWIHDNGGHVHLEQISAPFPLVAERNVQLSLRFVSLEGGPALRVVDSRVVLAQSLLQAFPVVVQPNYGAVLERAEVTIAGSVVHGGADFFGFAGPGPGIDLRGGMLVLGADTSILTGAASSLHAVSAITSIGGTIRLDGAARLVPVNGAPPISGSATVVAAPVPTTGAVISAGQLTTTIHAQPGERSFLLAALTLNPLAATPFGDLWLGWPHLVLDSGTVAADGKRIVVTPVPPQAAGTLVTLQAVVLHADNSLQLATPLPLTVD
jgi:hypothetical protein